MELNEALVFIQHNLKAPKGQTNTFGGYKYRSCEDILEAVKPLLTKTECTLTINDQIELIGSRYYVHTFTTLRDSSGVSTTTEAWAREPETKKGMDESQITGMASSYARKYALNALFAIDDTKDADTMDNRPETAEKTAKKANPKAAPTPKAEKPKAKLDINDEKSLGKAAEWCLKNVRRNGRGEVLGPAFAEGLRKWYEFDSAAEDAINQLALELWLESRENRNNQ